MESKSMSPEELLKNVYDAKNHNEDDEHKFYRHYRQKMNEKYQSMPINEAVKNLEDIEKKAYESAKEKKLTEDDGDVNN